MENNLRFIGRQYEIDLIEHEASNLSTSKIFFLNGEGGVGKTRLLQEISSRTSHLRQVTNIPLKITQLIDLANLSAYIPLNIEHIIANELGNSHFEAFSNIRDEYSKSQSKNLSTETINQQLFFACETFIREYNMFASDNRCIILIDTIDSHIVDSQAFLYFATNILPELQNSVVVMAGRKCLELYSIIKDKLHDSTQLLQLKGLKDEEAKLFLHGLGLSADLEEKIFFLTEGKPILLGLSLTWLMLEIPLPVIDECSLPELSSLDTQPLAVLRETFKIALVNQILKLEDEIYLYVLEMAHIEKRYNPEMLAFIHNISIEEAEKIILELSSFFFVKLQPDSVHVLHDEMRDMVKQLVWKQVDPLGDERKNISLKVIDFYGKKLNQIQKQIDLLKSEIDYLKEIGSFKELLPKARALSKLERYKWVLSSERFFYLLEVEPDMGGEQLSVELDQSSKQFTRDYSNILINVVQPYLRDLSSDTAFKVRYQIARWLRSVGQFEESKNLLEELLLHYPDDKHKKVQLLQTLSATEGDLGLSRQAFERLKEALGISERLELKKSVPYIINSMGMLLVSMGKVQEAIKEYKKCISYADELELEGLKTTAKNSMGYAYSILGDHDSASLYCESALEERITSGNKSSIASSHATLGSVYRDGSDFDRANLHYQHALEFFESNDDKYWMARIHMERGLSKFLEYEEKYYSFTERSATTTELLKGLLAEAGDDIKESIAIGEDYNLKEMPKALHELGHLYWELGDLYKAEEIWKESLEISRKSHNLRYLLENLMGFCELDLDRGLYARVLEHRKALQPYYEETIESHALLWSRLAKMEGHAAFQLGDFDTALQKFGYAFPTLAKHGGWGRYKLSIELQAVADKIDSLAPDMALKWCETLRQKWNSAEMHIDTKFRRMLDFFLEKRESKAKRRQKPNHLK